MKFIDDYNLSIPEEIIRLLTDGKIAQEHDYVIDAIAIYHEYGDDSMLMDLPNFRPDLIDLAKRNISTNWYLQLNHPFAPFPTPGQAEESLSGDAKFGFVNQSGSIFGRPWDLFTRIVLIIGMVGFGKSTLMKHLIIQAYALASRPFNIVVQDPSKQEYRQLTNVLPNLIVIPKNILKINPFQAKNTDAIPKTIRRFSDVFFNTGRWGDVSRNQTEKLIFDLYKQRGCLEGSQDWPTFQDLEKALLEMSNSYRGSRSNDMINFLTIRARDYAHEPMFQCRTGLDINYFMSNDLVVELDDLPRDVAAFAGTFISHGIFRELIEAGHQDGSLKALAFYEEAAELMEARREKGDWNESCWVSGARRYRAAGLGTCCCTQEPASVHPTIDSIANTRITFPLMSGKDVQYIMDTFRLRNEDQARYLYEMMPYGEALVRTAKYSEAFTIRIPPLDIGENPSQEVFEQRMEPFWADIAKYDTPIKEDIIEVTIQEDHPDIVTSAVLHHIWRHPFKATPTELVRSGICTNKELKAALRWLQDKALIKSQKFPTTKTNHPIYFILQENSFRLLEKRPQYGSKGSFEHSLYCHLISTWAQNLGHKALVEGKVTGYDKAMDVLVYTNDDFKVAYEVTLHTANLIHNIRADFASNIDALVIVVRNKKESEIARKIVESATEVQQYIHKIEYQLAYEFNQRQ